MPTHYVVRIPSIEETVNAAIKENEKEGAGLIQVLPVLVDNATSEVMLVFRVADETPARAAGFRSAVNPEP